MDRRLYQATLAERNELLLLLSYFYMGRAPRKMGLNHPISKLEIEYGTAVAIGWLKKLIPMGPPTEPS